MSNSSLISYTRISPNRDKPRKHAVDTITIHCTAGQCSIETLGEMFSNPSKEASSNYGIGPDGRIGLYVEESDRSWCSSNAANDHRAITIEVASEAVHPYVVNSKAYTALLDLCTDICRRNGIKKLIWSEKKEERISHKNGCNMTVHRDYANKACPGDYLYSKQKEIADTVNNRLTGNLYRVRKSWADAKTQIGAYSQYANAVRKAQANPGYTVFDESGTALYPKKQSSYLVEVKISDLNIRTGPGTSYPTIGKFTGKGIFTIVAEEQGVGAHKWGKLKSGLGWISLDYAEKIHA